MFDKLKKAETIRNLNYMLIPVNSYAMNEGGVSAFNEIYFYIKEHCKDFRKIVRTPSGGISIKKGNFRPHMYDIRTLKSCIEITVIAGFEGMFRIQLRTGVIDNKENTNISGHKAFWQFKQICKEHNINLDDFAITNGEEIKKSIPKAPIAFEKPYYQKMTLEHVHHLDLNSSYMAGIAEAQPELKSVIEQIYKARKEDEVNKAILTHTFGYMQSSCVKYKWSHLSKAAIEFNNREINRIRNNLLAQGFKPILYNTDGIWYTHAEGKVYHDEFEGKNLGQWKNDHVDCTFEAISEGKYHFIENGVVKTVMRGSTRLDKFKERDDWTWEDLYSTDAVIAKVIFNEEEGAKIIYG